MITIYELEEELRDMNYFDIRSIIDEIASSNDLDAVLSMIVDLMEEISFSDEEFPGTTAAIREIETDAYKGILDKEKTGNLLRSFLKDISDMGYADKVKAYEFMKDGHYDRLMTEEEAFEDFVRDLPGIIRRSPQFAMPYIDKGAMFRDAMVECTMVDIDGDTYYAI